jgi:hypothetical protein
MNIFFLSFSINQFSFLRAQPPEIVPKSTTTNIFGTHNDEEEQQVDIFPPGWIYKIFQLIDF